MAHHYSIEDMREVAFVRSGHCLSSEYKGGKTKLSWECKLGHQWDSTPFSIIVMKSWCPECAGTRRKTREEIAKLAEPFGGELLSPMAMTVMKRHRWRCARNHVFWARPADVGQGHWCPECAIAKSVGRTPKNHTIEEMRSIAHSRGGICLSSAYEGLHRKFAWQCAEGHSWMAEPNAVLSGHWCRKCADEARRRRVA